MMRRFVWWLAKMAFIAVCGLAVPMAVYIAYDVVSPERFRQIAGFLGASFGVNFAMDMIRLWQGRYP
jgi:hypothetical protein